MTVRRAAFVLCLLVVLVPLSGCIVLEDVADDRSSTAGPGSESESDAPRDQSSDPAAVFEGAFVHPENLDNVRGERTTTVTIGEPGDAETRTERVAVVERPYVEYRSEVLESSAPDRVGDVYVSNASVSWWYDPDGPSASYFPVEEPFDDEAVRADRAAQADRQSDRYDLEYLGTETVADREAHVLAVEAKNETVAEGISLLVGDTEFVYALETIDPTEELVADEQRLWIDAEYEYPLKEELVVSAESGDSEADRYVMTERFETVTFNDGTVSDDTFAFDPPENATVTDLTEE
ncbi:Outer membrane lipoprotein-sorting protein [Halobiforma haloterrestris]|uniref:Outer membrane lipoprotein-sorting protein n=1 Tax=Natronobacterium haloterrestre TaxID=148448 RepID=A0A1I1G7N4_NATHA|nr:outer membrane lipoprotein carrier protein LolA [Halobiforma haloterrestris]SFC05210.1 Outer membrane lipoprotein-sorting protein [Halobiforma haloterrestris]